ncbi:hypothetical protein AB6A23_09225 [Paenibacillus tarimensis]
MFTDYTESKLLRHFLATILYRAEKAIKGVPDNYPNLQIGKDVRSPIEILSHISHVLTCAHSVFEHYDSLIPPSIGSWEEEASRFYEIVEKLDKSLFKGLPNRKRIAEKLLQGPLSDAMTHVGQLSLLKRMADQPIPAESFFDADIKLIDR